VFRRSEGSSPIILAAGSPADDYTAEVKRMSNLETSLDALPLKSSEIISALQDAIKDATKSAPGKPVEITVSATPTPQGKWEICIGNLCIEI